VPQCQCQCHRPPITVAGSATGRGDGRAGPRAEKARFKSGWGPGGAGTGTRLGLSWGPALPAT
jgi:hypothetical protein